MHPLASDPTVPAILRRRFARVTHQLVTHFDDGRVGRINVIGGAKAEAEYERHLQRIGRKTRDGAELINVTLEDVN